jgi:hypothetical protein
VAIENGSQASPPQAVSVSPSSGTGSSQTFSFVFSDPNGFTDLATAYIGFSSTFAFGSACYSYVDRNANALWLLNDAGNAWVGPITPGAAGTLQNSQCTLNGAGSSLSGSSNNLTVNFALTFKAPFAGAKNVYMCALDNGGLSSNWQQRGTWTVPTANLPPTVVSVTPPSGSGSSQTFSSVFSDPNGFTDLATAYIGFSSTFAFGNACYSYYDRNANALWLLNDAGNAWVGPIAPGAATTLQNSQCTLNGAGSSVSGSSNNLTVNFALTFKAPFAGAKNVYMCALDNGGLSSNWQIIGTWTVPTPNLPPTLVSVTPSSGTGSSQTFSSVFSDPDGFTDLATTYIGFSSTFAFGNACYSYYDRNANALWLLNDAGNAWVGPIAPGAASTMQNSQCALNGAGSSLSGSSNNLTVNFALTFKAPFAGAKNIYMCALDNVGLSSNWQNMGSWTVPSGSQGTVTVTATLTTLQEAQLSLISANQNVNWSVAGPGGLSTPGPSTYTVYAAPTSITTNQTASVTGAAVGNPGNMQSVTLTLLRPAMTATATLNSPTGTVPSGPGHTATFTFGATDSAGFNNRNVYVYLMVTSSSSPSASAGCVLQYQPYTRTMWLADNNGVYIPSGTIGTPTILSGNNQCSVDLSSVTVQSANTTTLTISGVSITFLQSFAVPNNSTKYIYANTWDNYNDLGWWAEGSFILQASPIVLTPSLTTLQEAQQSTITANQPVTWTSSGPGTFSPNGQTFLYTAPGSITTNGQTATITGAAQGNPANSQTLNLTLMMPAMTATGTNPSTATVGQPVTFTLGGTDSAGFNNANVYVYLMVSSSSSPSADHGCILQYQPYTRTMSLADNTGVYISSGTIGTATILSDINNGQCSVDLSAITVQTPDATTLTVTGVAITFLPGFTGTKYVYGEVWDNYNYLPWPGTGTVVIN